MRPALEERETVINIGRLDKTASVYTSDERLITKLDKYVKEDCGWRFISQEMHEGDLVSKTYECPAEFISFRHKKRIGRQLTEEQKKASAENFRRYRETQNQK